MEHLIDVSVISEFQQKHIIIVALELDCIRRDLEVAGEVVDDLCRSSSDLQAHDNHLQC
jgi:hypothetical protein